MPSLAKVTVLWNFSVKINRYTFSSVVVKIPQNCNFSKAWHRLPEDGPDGPKHIGANMRYFNGTF